MPKDKFYAVPKDHSRLKLNQWDLVILAVVCGLLAALAWGAQQMTLPYEVGDAIEISLDLRVLPSYTVSTVLRMLIALAVSLLATFTVGTLAAKNKRAERVILPLIDILQSVPVLGFLSISVLAFIYLFPGSLLGAECAAIFAIFTSQAWNMILSFYQSLRTLPKDLTEVARMYHLSAWQTFWRIEVPFALPGLLWNTMISLSAGWFFVVASEAITVNNQDITLPGIGSYIHLALQQANFEAIGYAILSMLVVIVLYDQLLFRPLITWSEKFKPEPNEEIESQGAWFLNLWQRTQAVKTLSQGLAWVKEAVINGPVRHNKHPKARIPKHVKNVLSHTLGTVWDIVFLLTILGSSAVLCFFIYQHITLSEVIHVMYLGLITAFKIAILIILSSLIWVPIGVWVGLRPKVARYVQPIAQFLAAFPANLLWPVAVLVIVKYAMNVEIWTTPLIIVGTQWYILFNVIAGASTLPKDLHLASKNFGVRGWLWWKRLMLPSIFPYYITGAMAATGGCWNASILADVVTWGDTTLYATGLGGYITQYTSAGDFPRIALGIAVMCLYVTVINRMLWQQLYDLAIERYSVDTSELT